MAEREPQIEGDGKESQKKKANLDDPKHKENLKLAEQFQADFRDKMSGGKLELSHSQGSVEYKYIFESNGDGTVTITKINESERKEKKDSGLAQPKAKKTTVTFARLYANKVIALPEIGSVIAENKPQRTEEFKQEPVIEEDKDQSEKKSKKRKFQLEAGAMVPVSQVETTDAGHSDEIKVGGELVGRYVLTKDPQKSYVALTVPLQFENGANTLVPSQGPLIVSDSSTLALTAGVGIEAGFKPIKALAFYAGAGVKGEVKYVEYTNVSQYNSELITDDGSKINVAPGAFVTGGVRVNPTARWHIYGAIQPTKTFSSSSDLNIPVFLGTGFNL